MPHPTPAILPDCAQGFLDDLKMSPKTERSYRTALICLQRYAESVKLTPAKIPLPLTALAVETLASFYSWLRRRYRSNATIRLYLSAATQYLLWLEASGQLPPDVTTARMQAALSKKTGRRGQRVQAERRSADPAIGLLLDYYAGQLASYKPKSDNPQRELILLRNQALVQTLYATAGRAAEVASLQRADVADGRATAVNIVGKGNKRRFLILTPPAQAAIQAYVQKRTDHYTGLFISHGPQAGNRLSTQSLWRIVNDASRAVFGQNKKTKKALKPFGPHAFRHLRAQDLSDEGMPITTLQALLGHASVETTRSVYAPKTPNEVLLDQVATFGRSPAQVVQRAQASLGPPADPSTEDTPAGQPPAAT